MDAVTVADLLRADTSNVLARHWSGEGISSDELEAFATCLLLNDIESQSLRLLAGATAAQDAQDRRDLLDAALSELGIARPSGCDLIRLRIAATSRQVLSGHDTLLRYAYSIWSICHSARDECPALVEVGTRLLLLGEELELAQDSVDGRVPLEHAIVREADVLAGWMPS